MFNLLRVKRKRTFVFCQNPQPMVLEKSKLGGHCISKNNLQFGKFHMHLLKLILEKKKKKEKCKGNINVNLACRAALVGLIRTLLHSNLC
jgi:hypothetical protein